MEVVIGAGITALAVLIVGYVQYRSKLNETHKNTELLVPKADEMLLKQENTLQKGDFIRSEVKEARNDVKEAHNDIKKSQELISLIAKDITEEKAKETLRYENLSEKQKELVNVANQISAMGQEIQFLKEQVIILQKEKQQLLEENIELKYKLDNVQQRPLTKDDFQRGRAR